MLRVEIMDEKIREAIEELTERTQCPNNFRCAESGFEVLCKTWRVGPAGYLKCLECAERLEDETLHCKFALPFVYGYFCQCPLRACLCKKLKR